MSGFERLTCSISFCSWVMRSICVSSCSIARCFACAVGQRGRRAVRKRVAAVSYRTCMVRIKNALAESERVATSNAHIIPNILMSISCWDSRIALDNPRKQNQNGIQCKECINRRKRQVHGTQVIIRGYKERICGMKTCKCLSSSISFRTRRRIAPAGRLTSSTIPLLPADTAHEACSRSTACARVIAARILLGVVRATARE